MSRLPLSRSRRVLILSAAFGLSVLAASAAQAFTIDNQSGTNSDGSAKYTDPDSRFSNGGSSNSGPKYNFGNATVQFGTGVPGPQERYNTDRMFNPNGQPYGER
jgi:hypothetical protein